MSSVDVVVVGAGIAGLATAYELSRRGVSFVVLERAPRAGVETHVGPPRQPEAKITGTGNDSSLINARAPAPEPGYTVAVPSFASGIASSLTDVPTATSSLVDATAPAPDIIR